MFCNCLLDSICKMNTSNIESCMIRKMFSYDLSRRGVPKEYSNIQIKDIDFSSINLDMNYLENLKENINNGKGLYIYSKTTGNGKTVLSLAILNQYTINCIEDKINNKNKSIKDICYFVRMGEYQRLYSKQFYGDDESNIKRFEYIRNRIKKCKLIVLDDFGVRTSTDAFTNDIYDLLDYRLNNRMTTFFTSNIPINYIKNIYDERIMSRIYGLTTNVIVEGLDRRISNV